MLIEGRDKILSKRNIIGLEVGGGGGGAVSGGGSSIDNGLFTRSGSAGENITKGQAVFLKTSDSLFYKAKNLSSAETRAVGIAMETVTTGNSVTIALSGRFQCATYSFTVDVPIYLRYNTNLSETPLSTITANEDYNQILGFSLSANEIFIKIENSIYILE